MLPTFVIGLREGLEAALIVGIIAAFLRRQGRRDLLRWVYLGVGTAVLLCLGVGVALEVLSANLPQRQQEGLETIVGIFAICMVTYMVVWMRRHSRQLKAQLESLAADAIGKGDAQAGRAMVLMAFLAVLREGFETVVFLLAAFNATGNTTSAAAGAILGILVAVALGYGIYRGGVHLNLAKFFRVTGLVLVLVAAGLVVNALNTAHEAGWLNVGQGATVDLTWLVRPGSVRSSLLTGMLGLQDRPVVIEVIGWFAYLVPVGLYVAWPPGRRIPRRVLAWGAGGLALGATVVAIVLLAVAPARPRTNPPLAAGALSAQVLNRHDQTSSVRIRPQHPADPTGGSAAATVLSLRMARTEAHSGVATDVYTANVPGGGSASRPTRLTYAQIAALNGGRLPLGVRPPSGTSDDDTGAVAVRYVDTTTLTVWVEPRTGTIVDLRWDETVQVEAVGTPVGTVPLASPAAKATRALAPRLVRAGAARALAARSQSSRADELRTAALVAAGIAFVGLALAVALVAIDRRRPRRDMVSRVEQSTVAQPTS